MNRVMPLNLLAAALIVAAIPTLAAPVAIPDAPPPGPAQPIGVPTLTTQTLGNGLRIVVAPRPGLPLVTAQVLLLAGREADPADKTGLAAMTTTLLTRGARRGDQPVDAATLARQAEALGGTLDTATGWRSSLVGMTVTTPRLPAALALMADVVRQPLLAADELDRERARALDGLRVALDSPGSVAGLAAGRAWWGDSAYGRTATPASLGRLTADDLRAFHAAQWRPDRVVLVLAGDVDPAGARALAQQAFGDWARPASPPPVSQGSAAAPTLPPVLWVDMPGSGQSAVVVSAPAEPQGHADEVVGDVAQTLLGGGYSARLNQVIRIERGLSYGAFGGSEAHPAGGRWNGQAQTKHASAAEVAQLMRDAVARLTREPAPAAELAARQASLVGSFARRLETTAGLAGLVTGEVAAGRDPAALKGRVDAVRAVTPEQVRDYAARWWTPASLRVVVAGDWAAAGDGVKALGSAGEVRRLPKSALDLDRPDLGVR
ncbi:insulinase family protein [Rubrivivax albus]|uniref:Insulinase family protein n=2 Tax=Rubrivivax albus TaxID=2499835 RepID=A0A437JVS9_9BURK|nr:insulinase family protein [Rubrivivax albus]